MGMMHTPYLLVEGRGSHPVGGCYSIRFCLQDSPQPVQGDDIVGRDCLIAQCPVSGACTDRELSIDLEDCTGILLM